MERLRGRIEALRGNLFFVPMVYVVVAAGLAQASILVDRKIDEEGYILPTLLSSTVESARALLSTVAAATMTFAGIAFSVSLLMFQLASSQYSPRVLYGFFRDRLSKRVMGIAVGTFTYALLVLRVVRKPVEEGGVAILPHVSVLVAVTLGIISILAVLAFINHGAHSMEAAEIIRRIAEDTRTHIVEICPELVGDGPRPPILGAMPDGTGYEIKADKDGWVQQVFVDDLLEALPEGGVASLEVGAGMFVPMNTLICTVWAAPDDERKREELADDVRSAVKLGRTRTMEQDLAYGFRQLVDIALRALSPGINDPTTAREAIVHIGSLLLELLARDLPLRILVDDAGRRLYRPGDFTHEAYVDLAVDEIAAAAATQAAVVAVIIHSLRTIEREIATLSDQRAELVRRKIELVKAVFEEQEPMPHERARVDRITEGSRF